MKTIDLFAGIGGISTGMESVGFRTVFANDIDPRSKETYDLNYVTKLTLGDLQQIDITTLPEFDCLTGGFPCQPFSVAGKGKGFDDTRGTLFFTLASILKERHPRCFLLENVKQLYHHDGGRTFQTILRVLREDLGYTVYYNVLNSKDFGVPHNRERVFIVGFRENLDFIWPDAIGTPKFTSILENNPDQKYFYDTDHKHYKAMTAEVTDPDGIYQWRWSYVRKNKKGISPCLLASNMQPVIFLDRGRIRTLTPREGLRLQGFPDWFTFPKDMKDKDKFHQIGNSVSIPVIKSIATEMWTTLQEST